jgi:very-short-patch-repair endonuclease
MLRWTYQDENVLDWADKWVTTPMYRKDFQYVGPYFIGCDHGCCHGDSDHGAGPRCIGEELAHNLGSTQHTVVERCNQAIKDCDVFFAWLEEPCTAYGTLVELGIAVGLGKTVIVASPRTEEFHYDSDLWFAFKQADYIISLCRTAESAFRSWAERCHPIDEERAKCESPLELAFWDAYLCRKPSELDGLIAQHPLTANGRNYRLDFALPDKKIAFEMDGFTYHNDKDAFNRDRRRDLDLKLAGWQVHRFDGDLVRDDTPNVINIAAQLATHAA